MNRKLRLLFSLLLGEQNEKTASKPAAFETGHRDFSQLRQVPVAIRLPLSTLDTKMASETVSETTTE